MRAPSSSQVRSATSADAERCAVIYAPYVTDTAITFELRTPSPADIAERIAAASRGHAWAVLEDRGRVVGDGYGASFDARAAYRGSCAVSVDVHIAQRRRGGARGV